MVYGVQTDDGRLPPCTRPARQEVRLGHMYVSVLLGLFCCLVFLLPLAAAGVAGTGYGPLPTRSQNPLYLQLLALPMEATHTIPPGRVDTALHTAFSNVFERDATANTVLDLDMEVWRTALIFGYGLGPRLDVRFELPFVTTSGGGLDGLVQDFHATFNLPNEGRELVPDNQFNYMLSQNGVTFFDHDTQRFGLADMVVRLKISVPESTRLPVHLAFASYLKFPTGRSSQGLGSGRPDLGFALLAQKFWSRWYVTSEVGVVVLGGHADENIDDLLRVGFVSVGQSVEYRVISGLSVIVQLSGNTAAFKNVEGTFLSGTVVDLSVGVAGAFGVRPGVKRFFYHVAFTEDVRGTGPSVDFSVSLLAGVQW